MKQISAANALDSFDLAILRMLQVDSTIPQREIGEKVNLSTPSVQRRIKRMERDGFISMQAAILDPAAMGLSLTIIVEIELKVETGGKIDEIKESFLNAPEIQQCYYVTGEVDFIVIAVVRDMAEYEDLTRRMFFDDENIKRFRTLVTMDRIKATMDLNI